MVSSLMFKVERKLNMYTFMHLLVLRTKILMTKITTFLESIV